MTTTALPTAPVDWWTDSATYIICETKCRVIKTRHNTGYGILFVRRSSSRDFTKTQRIKKTWVSHGSWREKSIMLSLKTKL